ncbi:MAG: helix-turn-helix domain-containing protein [Clostridia bacterium]
MIGTILRNIRKIRGLTQSNVGDELNLADNTISNYETEYSNPNFDTIKKFIDVCDFEIQFVDKKNKKVYSIKDLSKEMDF